MFPDCATMVHSFSIPSHYSFGFLSSLSENRFDCWFSNPTFQSRVLFGRKNAIFFVAAKPVVRNIVIRNPFSFSSFHRSRSHALFREYGVPCWGGIRSVYLISQPRVGNGSLSARQSGGATTSAYPCGRGISRTFKYWKETHPFRQHFLQLHQTVSTG